MRRGRTQARTEPEVAEKIKAARPAPPKRRVRQRLLGALLVSVIAVLAAGAPGLVSAIGDLSQSQRLLRLTELNTSAIALAHSLADERDDMTAYVAAGRSTASGRGISEDERARVDRQATDVTQQAAALDTGGSADLARTTQTVRTALANLGHIRQTALSGPGAPKDAFDAYSPLIDALDGVSGALARALPARASAADTSAGPALAQAVDQASAEHGLLVAALTAGGTSSPLVTQAQQARLGEQSALADFAATATTPAQTQYAQTVTGTDVATAETYLRRLTAKSYLSESDNRLKTADVDSALSARVDRMRAVQASLAAADTTRLTTLRDDDVTALELRATLVGLCALLALGIGVRTTRSVTRPLAALRRYAGDQQPPVPTGSRDEFAAVALAVERLAEDTVRLRAETAEQEKERVRLVGERQKVAAERDGLRRQQAELRGQAAALMAERDELLARVESLRGVPHATFINLSLRTLALIERQLALIEGLEDREQDPDELKTLFRLDHLATRMRRNNESLLVLAGAETSGGALAKPVPLLDVVRAGVSEVERYERVRIPFLPRAQVAGFAADDTAHLVAELLENATAFSPPHADVQVTGWLLENGEAMLSVEDAGIGIPHDRLDELNQLLADPHPDESHATAGLGLYVVARLAGRHGIRVQLREQKQGGVTAVVVLPRTLIVHPAESVAPPQDPYAAPVTGAADQAPATAPAVGAKAVEAAAPAPRRAAETDEHARTPAAGDGPTARPRHARTEEAAQPEQPARSAPDDQTDPESGGLTGKGLPKRVPRASGLTGEPADRPRNAPVDADALRRRLGGFAHGLRQGRRDAEAEATGTVEPPRPPAARQHQQLPQHRQSQHGEPSEEARG
ncbi:sensor histidine kinase [Streptomyces sp. RPT161]|uniref:sensor histidine kinase n=1 Tax=Streptomyces sp. RPT161 TaxID=3015993 RepID=UPI0022B9127A|nr:nitrate- and nitrite sensing domain-containing protein [Streptomyces sp. RPT161]